MGSSLIAYPNLIFRQSTAPTASAGKFWIDTDTDEIFYCPDGTTWVEIPTSSGSSSLAVIENMLSILEIQAADTITPDTSAQFVRDIFADADGYLNTIDTGNTTATFNTDKYSNASAGANRAETTDSGYSTGADSTYMGLRATADVDCLINSVTKSASDQSDTFYILDSSYNLLATASYSGNTATLSAPLALTATNDYLFVNYKSSSRNIAYKGLAHDNDIGEITTKGRCWLSSLDGTGYALQAGYTANIVSFNISTLTSGLITQTDAITLSSTPTKFIIMPFRSSGTFTADISFDNGANYQTAIPMNTETSITNTGDTMILKLNHGSAPAEADGYGVLYW